MTREDKRQALVDEIKRFSGAIESAATKEQRDDLLEHISTLVFSLDSSTSTASSSHLRCACRTTSRCTEA